MRRQIHIVLEVDDNCICRAKGQHKQMALAIVKTKRLRDILVNAFEGGSNYWYRIEGYELKPGVKFDDFREGGELQPEGDYFHWSQLIPTTNGNTLFVSAPGGFATDTPVALNLKTVRQGANVMATMYPKHWANVLSEDDDCETADVFLQCCMFGEIIFG